MAHAITKTSEVRCTLAPVRIQIDIEFLGSKFGFNAPYDYLAREFHAGSFQLHSQNLFAIERSQPAVPIAAWGSVQQST